MKPNQTKNSTQAQISEAEIEHPFFETPHQQAILTPPNPPSPEMVERAKFVDKTYVWNKK